MYPSQSLLFMIREITTLLPSLLYVTLVTWTFPLVSGTFPLLHMSRSSSPTSQQVPAAGAAVSTVSLKLPSFWPADPELWFAQVDAQFRTKKITSQLTKFEHVIASLSPQYATEVRDLILKPPATNLYDKLREELVKRTTASEQRRLQLLFNAEELGDRTPSQLLRRMQQLLGDKAATADKSFLRELFMQRLPPNVRMVLASTKEDEELESLASLADKVVEVAAPVVATVQSSQLSSEMEYLRSEIASLKRLVQSLSTTPRRKHSPRRRTPSPAPPVQSTGLCWYHSRFAEKAAKCLQPCSWESENGLADR